MLVLLLLLKSTFNFMSNVLHANACNADYDNFDIDEDDNGDDDNDEEWYTYAACISFHIFVEVLIVS